MPLEWIFYNYYYNNRQLKVKHHAKQEIVCMCFCIPTHLSHKTPHTLTHPPSPTTGHPPQSQTSHHTRKLAVTHLNTYNESYS